MLLQNSWPTDFRKEKIVLIEEFRRVAKSPATAAMDARMGTNVVKIEEPRIFRGMPE